MTDQFTVMPDGDRGCGARLRKAREAAGLSQAEVSARLKMPLRVVRSLEEEDWGHLGAPVFVRGQLRSYSRLLGLATAPVQAAYGIAPIEPPVLVPRTYTPPMQRLFEQLARRFLYIVLTALIAVPIWLTTRPHLGITQQSAAPLDVHAVGAAAPAQAADEPTPMVASLGSLPASAVPQAPLELHFNGDSWLQVTGRDGHVIEQVLAHAGEQRSYPAGQVAGMTLGNAAAVQVLRNGQPQDLAPYLRANVARFTVSSAGSLAPAVD